MYSIYGIASFISSPGLHHTTAWNNGNGITKYMFQRRRCYAFDSPGLPNDSAGYPGLVYVVRGTTPSVLRFFWLICHKRFHCKRAFIEKAQHLWRWISLWTFTQGRLVPRQPRAIKRTTRTALHHGRIYIAKHVHWNNGMTPTALHRYHTHYNKYIQQNIDIKNMVLHRYHNHHSKYIHWNIGIKNMALHHCNTHNGGCINWDIGTFCYLLVRMLASIVLWNECFNAVGVAPLIAQGCQTIVQATLG